MVEVTTWGIVFEAEYLTEPKVLNWLETAWPASPGDSPKCLLALGLEVCANQPTLLHWFWRSEFAEPFPQSIKFPSYFLNPSFIYSLLNHWISDHILCKLLRSSKKIKKNQCCYQHYRTAVRIKCVIFSLWRSWNPSRYGKCGSEY